MERRQVTCSNCFGRRRHLVWNIVNLDDKTSTMQEEEVVCTQCNGTGYTEYAVFSIEEAEAILKHCGLTTESEEV